MRTLVKTESGYQLEEAGFVKPIFNSVVNPIVGNPSSASESRLTAVICIAGGALLGLTVGKKYAEKAAQLVGLGDKIDRTKYI